MSRLHETCSCPAMTTLIGRRLEGYDRISVPCITWPETCAHKRQDGSRLHLAAPPWLAGSCDIVRAAITASSRAADVVVEAPSCPHFSTVRQPVQRDDGTLWSLRKGRWAWSLRFRGVVSVALAIWCRCRTSVARAHPFNSKHGCVPTRIVSTTSRSATATLS